MTQPTIPGSLERERRFAALSTYGDIIKIMLPAAIGGIVAAVGLYWQVQTMKEANAADRQQQTQTLYRIENKVEKIDDSVRTIENKVTSLEEKGSGTERRVTLLERSR